MLWRITRRQLCRCCWVSAAWRKLAAFLACSCLMMLHVARCQLGWLSEKTFYVERTAKISKICITLCVYTRMPPSLCLIYRLSKPMCTARIPKNKQFFAIAVWKNFSQIFYNCNLTVHWNLNISWNCVNSGERSLGCNKISLKSCVPNTLPLKLVISWYVSHPLASCLACW